jgi:hypothetical protein
LLVLLPNTPLKTLSNPTGSYLFHIDSYDNNLPLSHLCKRLGSAIDSIGAKRKILDTIEVLFARVQELCHFAFRVSKAVQMAKEQGSQAHCERRAWR